MIIVYRPLSDTRSSSVSVLVVAGDTLQGEKKQHHMTATLPRRAFEIEPPKFRRLSGEFCCVTGRCETWLGHEVLERARKIKILVVVIIIIVKIRSRWLFYSHFARS